MAVTIEHVKPRPALAGQDSAAAFEALFDQHWPRVYGVLLRLTGDPAEAEDLALEVFWRLHQHPPTRGDAANMGGWLYRVAANLGYNALRAARRRRHYEQEAGALIQQPRRYSSHPKFLLIWVKDGIVYALSGEGDTATALLIANSLK